MNQLRSAIDACAPQAARFTVEQFIAIDESGALNSFAKAELIDGQIVVVNAQTVWHMRARMAVTRAFQDAIAASRSTLEVGGEASVTVAPDHMPEPDIFIWETVPDVKWVPGDSLRLVVEIASSSERHDMGEKLRLYAEHGVPEYWVVVERTGRIERFVDPVDGTYRRQDSFTFLEGCTSATMPDVVLPGGLIRN